MNLRPSAATLCLLLGATLPAYAADAPAAPPAPPDDLDALSLADKAPTAAAQPAPKWRIFVEGAASRGTLRDTGSHIDTTRASLDVRFDATVSPGLRAVFSDRLDLLHSNGEPPAENVNTLREAYLSWARAEDQIFDLGRVNVRHGAALGFNPTDWFKENALRSVVSADPNVLRENRQGTVVLQGQQLWSRGALTATYSPRLSRSEESATFALNAGATNPSNRWLLAGSYKVSDKVTPELLLYGGDDTPTQVGLNVSALVSDAAVVFGEVSAGKGPSLVAQSFGLPEPDSSQRRAALGLIYTTSFNLSFTAEADYSSAAPNREQWNALSNVDPAARQSVLATAAKLQDLPVRREWFFYATWQDALFRQLDLSAFVRHEGETSSRAQWLEARYRWDRADLSVQFLTYSGDTGSVYASIPQRRTAQLALRFYL